MATLSAPLLRSHHHRHLPIRSSPRRCSPAAAFPHGFAPLKPLSSCGLRPRTAVRSSSTAPPSAPEAAEDTEHAAHSEAAEEEGEARVVLPTNESSERLLRIRHTCAHVMAMAVQKLFPNSKVTIGPWIENGFYYDFDMEPLIHVPLDIE